MALGNLTKYTYRLGWFFVLATFAYKGLETLTNDRIAVHWIHATQLLETSALMFLICIATEAYRHGSLRAVETCETLPGTAGK